MMLSDAYLQAGRLASLYTRSTSRSCGLWCLPHIEEDSSLTISRG